MAVSTRESRGREAFMDRIFRKGDALLLLIINMGKHNGLISIAQPAPQETSRQRQTCPQKQPLRDQTARQFQGLARRSSAIIPSAASTALSKPKVPTLGAIPITGIIQ
jgi:hypothetical protein